MPPHRSTRNSLLSAMGLALSMACSNAALARDAQTPTAYDIVPAPPCTNYKGETVQFIERSNEGSGLAAGMAIRDRSGKPVIFRSNYAAAPPEFQRFIDRHECAHHQTGDVDRPHPPRNSAEHLMNESISDCVAILRLRDEEAYNRASFSKVAAAMRHDMAKIGFPEISIGSRIRNIDNCYTKYGSPRNFIHGILKHRGL